MKRQTHSLSDQEFQQFKRLRFDPFQNAALAFWGRVATSRGLDPDTIISEVPLFSGLPRGHGKHWCYPLTLKCKGRPIYKED